jgi:hypothetical protein
MEKLRKEMRYGVLEERFWDKMGFYLWGSFLVLVIYLELDLWVVSLGQILGFDSR